ncbi:MAG: sigma-54 dependent transcriptional regulator [Paludibaculum sp.]
MDAPKDRVLVVDDESNQRTALATMIAGWGYETASAANGAEALDRLREFEASAIVTDLMMPGMDGSELLRRLKDQGQAPPAIVLTAFGNLETAIALVHDLGAFWFLEKPLQPGALRLLLSRAVAQSRLTDYNEALERRLSEQGVLGNLVGGSDVMQRIFSLIRQVAPTRATVLITGESGTGKELAPRAIHDCSPRRDNPFIAINCAALTETLIESELFGHEKGSFTGAFRRTPSRLLEAAEGGTVLLDEIGECRRRPQAKLLRVLEEREVRREHRPGSGSRRPAAGRHQSRPDGRGKTEPLPRRSLLPAECVRSLAAAPAGSARGHPRPVRSDDPRHEYPASVPVTSRHEQATMNLLQSQESPGNARELRNVVERAVIIAGEGPLQPGHFIGLHTSARAPVVSGDEVRLQCGRRPVRDEAERALIEATLVYGQQSNTRAATILGISQKTLFNKLREYGTPGGTE